ncbi:MAG: hypothetical protein H7Y11_13075 [Armatimonadetes bacterium]|nr:hypothetical protein [Anaerolineae bacterium]
MTDTTLVLALEGDVTLEQFSEAVNHFYKLLLQLTQEVAADTKIEWDLEDLQYGSAIMTVAGRADSDETVLRVVSAFEEVGQSLQQHTPIPFSRHVAKEAEALTKLISHNIKTVRLGTARKEAIIYSLFDAKKIGTAKPMVSFGTVKGRVQSISNRGKLHFTLYDAVFDKRVSCYVKEDRQAILTDVWDKMVFVSGRVTRQPDSGQPVSIREISAIDFVPMVAPGSYRQARGVLAGTGEPEPAEISIRRLRDAEN